MRLSAAPISSSKPGCHSLGACTTPSIELNSPAVTLRIGRFLSFVPALRRVVAPATNEPRTFDTTSENFFERLSIPVGPFVERVSSASGAAGTKGDHDVRDHRSHRPH